jgi:hypothetical protein
MSKRLVRCPCGQPEAVICTHCSRSCCAEHHAFTPTGKPGTLDPACFPRCDAKWRKMARVDAYAAKIGQSEEEQESIRHAGRLLLREGDPSIVADEVGLSWQRVKDLAKHLR